MSQSLKDELPISPVLKGENSLLHALLEGKEPPSPFFSKDKTHFTFL